jgi:hypothetical protein
MPRPGNSSQCHIGCFHAVAWARLNYMIHENSQQRDIYTLDLLVWSACSLTRGNSCSHFLLKLSLMTGTRKK